MRLLESPVREVGSSGAATRQEGETRLMRWEQTDPNSSGHVRSTGVETGQFFSAAMILARKGRYIQAQELLQKALDAGECSKAEELDLLARIYVQQGRHLDAETCWREAKRLDATNPAFDENLSRLRNQRLSSVPVVHWAIAVSTLAFGATLLWLVLVTIPGLADRQDDLTASIGTLRGELNGWRRASEQESAKFSAQQHQLASSLIALRVDLDGWHHTGKQQTSEIAAAVGNLQQALAGLDQELAKMAETLPTTDQMEGQRAVILSQLGEQTAAVQKTVEQKINSLESSVASTGEKQAKDVQAVDASLASLKATVEDANAGLDKRMAGMEAMTMALRDTLASKPTSNDLSAVENELKGSIGALAASLANIQEAVGKVEKRFQENATAIAALQTESRKTASAIQDMGGYAKETASQHLLANDTLAERIAKINSALEQLRRTIANAQDEPNNRVGEKSETAKRVKTDDNSTGEMTEPVGKKKP